jgi:penicillin amidase
MEIALPKRHNAWRWLTRCIALIVTACILALLAAVAAIALSMPVLDGTRVEPRLQSRVSVARDAQGVPTLAGGTRADLAYATGFVHAQERFFQMDLLRRSAAGTLAALIGPAALPLDRAHRIYRFDSVAGKALTALSPADKTILEHYAAGVNAGLAALSVRPFEYLALGTKPLAWRPQDSLLVVWAMYFDLQESQRHYKFARAWLRAHTDAQALAVLLPGCSEWDAPLDAPSVACDAPPIGKLAPNWLGGPSPQTLGQVSFGTEIGSNNWALAGTRTATGSAIVSNDMHLNLRLPNIWYRVVFEYPEAAGAMRRIVGVTLPGTPAAVAGSNGAVAWGFTNGYGNDLDLVELQSDPRHPNAYRTAGGWAPIEFENEILEVKGGPAETLRVAETALGPVWEVGGKRYAVKWVANDPGAVDVSLLRMEAVESVAEALATGAAAGIPAQNLIAGDAAGNIGWTIAGAMPNRHSRWNDTLPYPSDARGLGFDGLLPAREHPSIVNPPSGQLWSANARQLAGGGYDLIGDGGADLGARARQIRDDLAARRTFDERDAYAPSLDDRALFLAPWRRRALRVLDEQALAGHPQRAEFKRLLLHDEEGCACIDSVGYRLTRGFLHNLYGALFGAADVQMRKLDPNASMAQATPRWPVVVARLVDEEPPGWLPKGQDSWRAVKLAAVDRTIAQLTAQSVPLAGATWGRRNTSHVEHPMASAMPVLSRWLAAPADPLPGDGNMPRVAAPAFGQSERMVVSPSHEDHGIFNMPGGQSGHPFSAYFLAGHEDWVHGRPAPLLPGPQQHLLILVPAASEDR